MDTYQVYVQVYLYLLVFVCLYVYFDVLHSLHVVCRLVYFTHFHFCTHIHAVVIICVCQIFFIKETACLRFYSRQHGIAMQSVTVIAAPQVCPSVKVPSGDKLSWDHAVSTAGQPRESSILRPHFTTKGGIEMRLLLLLLLLLSCEGFKRDSGG